MILFGIPKEMIIKKMSRKTPSFKNLLDYMMKDAQGQPIITYNIFDSSPDGVIREFKKNAQFIRKRKNGNYLYHEIISFHPKDRDKLTPEVLEDLAQRYMELRTKRKGLACGVVHFDHHPHVHFMIAANEIGKSQKLDLSGKEFFSFRKSMEAYQKKKYPFLTHSLVFDEGREKSEVQKSLAEQEKERKLKSKSKPKRETEKEGIRNVVQKCLQTTFSLAEFESGLVKRGFEFYLRGKTPGIQRLADGKKFRLKKLGLFELFQKMNLRWERFKNRKIEIRSLLQERGGNHLKNRLIDVVKEKVLLKLSKVLTGETLSLRETQRMDDLIEVKLRNTLLHQRDLGAADL